MILCQRGWKMRNGLYVTLLTVNLRSSLRTVNTLIQFKSFHFMTIRWKRNHKNYVFIAKELRVHKSLYSSLKMDRIME